MFRGASCQSSKSFQIDPSTRMGNAGSSADLKPLIVALPSLSFLPVPLGLTQNDSWPRQRSPEQREQPNDLTYIK